MNAGEARPPRFRIAESPEPRHMKREIEGPGALSTSCMLMTTLHFDAMEESQAGRQAELSDAEGAVPRSPHLPPGDTPLERRVEVESRPRG